MLFLFFKFSVFAPDQSSFIESSIENLECGYIYFYELKNDTNKNTNKKTKFKINVGIIWIEKQSLKRK